MPGEGQSVANETEETPRPSVSRMDKLKRYVFCLCVVFFISWACFVLVFFALNGLNGLGLV